MAQPYGNNITNRFSDRGVPLGFKSRPFSQTITKLLMISDRCLMAYVCSRLLVGAKKRNDATIGKVDKYLSLFSTGLIAFSNHFEDFWTVNDGRPIQPLVGALNENDVTIHVLSFAHSIENSSFIVQKLFECLIIREF